MSRFVLLCVALLLAAVSPAASETLRLAPDLSLEMALPAEGWVMSSEPPPFLLESTAEHLEHELAAAGKEVDDAKVRALAARRLAANEAYVYNPASGAVLTIDVSPLREGEAPPSRRAVATSARYAGEGLADEEGVADLDQRSARVEVAGAEHAYRIDARYRHHEQPTQFIGIVGFVSPYWLYLYYTDRLVEPGDAAAVDRALATLVLRPAGG